jgi:hypothetical protein
VRYQYIRSKLEDHTIAISYVPTEQQVADMLTKSLEPAIFIPLRDRLLGITRSEFIDSFLHADS